MARRLRRSRPLKAARRSASVEVETTDEVTVATGRLSELGLFTEVENDTTCCYAVQDKVWVHGPGAEPWEAYVVKADALDDPSFQAANHGVPEAEADKSANEGAPAQCCTPTGS